MRRVGGIRGIDVEIPRMRSITRSVAIAVGEIGGGTTSGELFAPWRLRELPDGGVRQSAGGWRKRILRRRASPRGRAGIVVDPVDDAALTNVLADVIGSNDGDTAAFVDGHARTIYIEFCHPIKDFEADFLFSHELTSSLLSEYCHGTPDTAILSGPRDELTRLGPFSQWG